jgi:arginyl-tRNA synthetase
MHIVHEIGSELEHIAKQLSGEGLEFDVSVTSNPSQGDISSNIALIHFKKLGFNSPREAAVKIAADFEANSDPCIEKIEIAGPGFINFFLSAHYLQGALNTFTQNNFDSRKTNTLHSQKNKVIVEFGDPNPFKEIHIGHLRNFCIGESFSRTLSATGNEVVRANYQGDVGLHVAKAMWGLLKREEQFLDSSLSEEEKVKLLAASYVEGATEFEANEDTKAEIIDINKRIYSDDESLHQLWEEGRKVSLEHFERD